MLIVSVLSVSSALAQQECAAPPPSNENLLVKHDFYINGSWVPPVPPQQTLQVIDPSTADPVASISLGNQADVDLAVSAAREAFGFWAFEITPEQRGEYIEKLLEIYTQRQDEMAQLISLEMGAPIDMALHSQVGSGTYWIQSFLDELEDFKFERTVHDATTILMDPIGVVALITPWNWPMNQVVLKVIPALAVGCTCILKPSELAPLSSLLFAEMIHDAGFPPGVFNLVNGDGAGVGTQLSGHPGVDMVSFTGSTRAGALVSKAAADTFKRVTLELGT
jgi:aldehyde dehydrogenase (NAD+)